MTTTIQLENRVATMTTHFIDTKEDLPVIVICPGGAYCYRSDREGTPIAREFNQNGFHAVILNYDLTKEVLHDEPLKDVAAAITYLRKNAASLHINPNQIIVCGFSAGGHLAASMGVFWNDKNRFPEEEVRHNQKPNGLILCYPVITSGIYAHRESINRLTPVVEEQAEYSLETKVNDDVPPCFIWHTMTDNAVPVQNSLFFINALLDHNISCEALLMPRGGHGLSLATKEVEEVQYPGTADSHIARWFDQCVDWVKKVIVCN